MSSRRGFLKAFALAVAGAVVAPGLGTGYVAQECTVPVDLMALKVALVEQLIANAWETHDRLFEEAIFSTIATPGSFADLCSYERIDHGA